MTLSGLLQCKVQNKHFGYTKLFAPRNPCFTSNHAAVFVFLSNLLSNNPHSAYTMIKIYSMRMMLQRVRQHFFISFNAQCHHRYFVAKYSVLCNVKYK